MNISRYTKSLEDHHVISKYRFKTECSVDKLAPGNTLHSHWSTSSIHYFTIFFFLSSFIWTITLVPIYKSWIRSSLNTAADRQVYSRNHTRSRLVIAFLEDHFSMPIYLFRNEGCGSILPLNLASRHVYTICTIGPSERTRLVVCALLGRITWCFPTEQPVTTLPTLRKFNDRQLEQEETEGKRMVQCSALHLILSICFFIRASRPFQSNRTKQSSTSRFTYGSFATYFQYNTKLD